MIGKILSLFVVVGLATATKPFEGVDPNELSCDPAGEVYLLLPHFSDCTKFFMCAHGNEVEFTCSGGLIFDFALQGCNWDWDATCILRTPKEDAEAEDEEQDGDGVEDEIEEGSGDPVDEDSDDDEVIAPEGSGEGSGDDGNNEEQAFASHVINCSSAEQASRHVAYRGDCQRYWRCVDGIPVSTYCSDGLFFNEKTQQCDFEGNVGCTTLFEDDLNGEFIVY